MIEGKGNLSVCLRLFARFLTISILYRPCTAVARSNIQQISIVIYNFICQKVCFWYIGGKCATIYCSSIIMVLRNPLYPGYSLQWSWGTCFDAIIKLRNIARRYIVFCLATRLEPGFRYYSTGLCAHLLPLQYWAFVIYRDVRKHCSIKGCNNELQLASCISYLSIHWI